MAIARDPADLDKVGKSEFDAGNYGAALEKFRQAAEAYAALGDSANRAEQMNNVGVALLQLGKPGEAFAAVEGTETVFEKAGDPRRQGIAANNQAAALEGLNRPNEAIVAYERAAQLLGQAGEGALQSEALKAPAAISNLIFFQSHVHKHLDWKAPLEWLGSEPFMLLQQGPHLAAALACPPDPAAVAWLRLFVFDSQLNGSTAWRMLWPAAQAGLEAQGCPMAAAIAVQRWLDPILVENGFELVNHIVLMEMNIESAAPAQYRSEYPIRPMVSS